MKHNPDFAAVISEIRQQDGRFEPGAYHFVRQGLDHTIKTLEEKEPERESSHVSGQELLEGIRQYALEQYGPMALTLFEHWGVQCCEDFGEIVFQLVDQGVLGKTESDRLEDFADGYDFAKAFAEPFLPASRRSAATS